jgi:Mg2+/Co2+ transporter CorB
LESEPYLSEIFFSNINLHPINLGVGIAIALMALLLVLSALISGSEVAFFSLSPSEKDSIKSKNTTSSERILKLSEIPERLLATILISNNLINVAIVIISTFITTSLFDFAAAPVAGFLFQVIIVTFLLLVFGEILPKLYAKHNSVRFSIFMSQPLFVLEKIYWWLKLSWLLTSSSQVVNKFAKNKQNISLDELG